MSLVPGTILAARFEEGLGAAAPSASPEDSASSIRRSSMSAAWSGACERRLAKWSCAASPTKVPSGRCKPAEKAVSIRAILWMRLLLWREPQEGGSGPVESASEGIKAFHKTGADRVAGCSTQALSLCKIIVEIDDDAPRGRLVLPCADAGELQDAPRAARPRAQKRASAVSQQAVIAGGERAC